MIPVTFANTVQAAIGAGAKTGLATAGAASGGLGGFLSGAGAILSGILKHGSEVSRTAVDIATAVQSFKTLEMNKNGIIASAVGAKQATPAASLTAPGGTTSTNISTGSGGLDPTMLIVLIVGAFLLLKGGR